MGREVSHGRKVWSKKPFLASNGQFASALFSNVYYSPQKTGVGKGSPQIQEKDLMLAGCGSILITQKGDAN